MKKKIKELREKYILNPAHFYVGYFSFIPLPTTADKSLSYQHLDLWLPVSSLLSLNIPDPYNGSYALTMESLEILPDSLLLILEMIFLL